MDDLGDSDIDTETVDGIIREADKVFESAGLKCKGWSVSGRPPHPDVTVDGSIVDVGGIAWCPALDTVSIKIPPIHFGKKARGKLKIGTEVFEGSFADLEKFVPQKLTRRMIVSKFWSIFDLFGHLTPQTARMKMRYRSIL